MTPARIVLATLATARLTRLVTRDKLPEHLVIRHVRARALWHTRSVPVAENLAVSKTEEVRDRPANAAAYLEELLDCPFCVGFWIGLLVLIGEATVAKLPVAGTIWRIMLAALAMNYIVAHVSSRID